MNHAPISETAALQDRASQLHQTSLVVDAACPGDFWAANFDKWLAGGGSCCFTTVASVESCRETLREIGAFYKLVRDNEESLVLATSTEDIRQAKVDGKLAVVLQFQGTHPLEYDLNLVEVYWRLGVRVMQLAYNQRSPVCDGCEEPGDAGLSAFGHRVVGELNRLGIAVDLSHTGERASYEAVEVSTAPCIVSHANAKAVHPSNRNLSDGLIKAVAKNAGVIGLNAFPAFVAAKQRTTIDDLVDHFVHIDSVAGSGHVGLGLDYCAETSMSDYEQLLAEGIWRSDTYPPPPYRYPLGLENPSNLDRLTERLVERGYSDDEIRGVLGENWLRALSEIWIGGESAASRTA